MSESDATARQRIGREQILDAATAEFLAKGYQKTTISSVVRVIGGSNRNIYDYFGDKFGLYCAVLERFTERMMSSIDAPEPAERSPEQQLATFAAAYLHSCMQPDALAMHRLVIAEAVQFPALGQQVLRHAEGGAMRRLAGYLTEITGQGVAADTEGLAGMFMALIRGEMHLRAAYTPDWLPDEAQIGAYVTKAIDLFLNGLRPRG